MSFEKQVRKKLDELESKGELEFKDGEDLEGWIRRISVQLPDPWASVKRFIKEKDESNLQKWVDAHRVR